METTAIEAIDPCPKGIVSQLLDIAKANDATSEIGGATGWRWQEGIISRMPKVNTVAKVLRKAYGTNDPNVWVENCSGDLRKFLQNIYALEGKVLTNFEPQNLFEAVCYTSLVDGRGVTKEELSYRLSFIKYAQSYEDDGYFIDIDEKLVLKLHFEWANSTVEKFLNKYEISCDNDGFYSIPSDNINSNEKLTRYQVEIGQLRHKLVGSNSRVDMWRNFTVALNDKEMIEVELKLLEYYKNLVSEIKKRTSSGFRCPSDQATRIFSISSVTLKNKEGGL